MHGEGKYITLEGTQNRILILARTVEMCDLGRYFFMLKWEKYFLAGL